MISLLNIAVALVASGLKLKHAFRVYRDDFRFAGDAGTKEGGKQRRERKRRKREYRFPRAKVARSEIASDRSATDASCSRWLFVRFSVRRVGRHFAKKRIFAVSLFPLSRSTLAACGVDKRCIVNSAQKIFFSIGMESIAFPWAQVIPIVHALMYENISSCWETNVSPGDRNFHGLTCTWFLYQNLLQPHQMATKDLDEFPKNYE